MSDFDYELQMAQMNFRLEEFDTVFIATNPEYGYLSSSLVRGGSARWIDRGPGATGGGQGTPRD